MAVSRPLASWTRWPARIFVVEGTAGSPLCRGGWHRLSGGPWPGNAEAEEGRSGPQKEESRPSRAQKLKFSYKGQQGYRDHRRRCIAALEGQLADNPGHSRAHAAATMWPCSGSRRSRGVSWRARWRKDGALGLSQQIWLSCIAAQWGTKRGQPEGLPAFYPSWSDLSGILGFQSPDALHFPGDQTYRGEESHRIGHPVRQRECRRPRPSGWGKKEHSGIREKDLPGHGEGPGP